MALELFKPFVYSEASRSRSEPSRTNIKSAKKHGRARRPASRCGTSSKTWSSPSTPMHAQPCTYAAPSGYPGIRAAASSRARPFSSTRWCAEAFNADFDGDQMAVHLPLSVQRLRPSARMLDAVLEQHPQRRASGRPLAMPRPRTWSSGLFHLTTPRSFDEGVDRHELVAPSQRRGRVRACTPTPSPRLRWQSTAARISVRRNGEIKVTSTDRSSVSAAADLENELFPEGWNYGDVLDKPPRTLGRVLFNELLPADYPSGGQRADAEEVIQCDRSSTISPLASTPTRSPVLRPSTSSRTSGSTGQQAQVAGVTVSISDVLVPPEKPAIIEDFEASGRTRSRSSTSKMVDVWTKK